MFQRKTENSDISLLFTILYVVCHLKKLKVCCNLIKYELNERFVNTFASFCTSNQSFVTESFL